jgi:hypothetical protein
VAGGVDEQKGINEMLDLLMAKPDSDNFQTYAQKQQFFRAEADAMTTEEIKAWMDANEYDDTTGKATVFAAVLRSRDTAPVVQPVDTERFYR